MKRFLWNIFSKDVAIDIKSTKYGVLYSLIEHSWNNTGLWKRDDGVHSLAKVAVFCFIISLFTLYIGFFRAKDDVETLFECFSVGTFTTMAAFKLQSLFSNGQRWRFLLSQINFLENIELNKHITHVEYESDDEEKFSFNNYIKNYTDRFHTLSTRLSRMYYFSLTIHMASPFMQYCMWKLQGDESGYPHMLPGWVPLDSIGLIGYVITILVEVLACIYSVLVHITFDLTVVGLSIFLCGQFVLLRDYSETIGGSGNEYTHSIERDDRAHFRIMECHRIYITLVKSIAELNELIKNIMGVYFFVATLTLCSVAYRLVAEELSTMQIASLLQYMCANLTQLFLFCYYGDAVMHESSVGMGRGPFGAAYWSLSTRTRRELLLLGITTSEHRRLCAGPFNYVNLPSFIQIIRAAYSYYAVLQK